MPSKSKVTWHGQETIEYNLQNHADRVRLAVRMVAAHFAIVFEGFAKENASWRDQTGNARQGLTGFVEELSEDIVRIYLAHGVDYGIYLETRWAGKYAIIWPTISSHLWDIYDMLSAFMQAA